MHPLVRLCRAAVAALALALLFSATQQASAADFVVNSLGASIDANPGDGACADAGGACTLPAAVFEANFLAGHDQITFSVTGTINLTNGIPELSSDMTITGPGAALLTVRRDSGGLYSVINVGVGANVNISGITISNGRTFDGDGGGSSGNEGGRGGGVRNLGTLSLTACVVSGNTTGKGGAGTTFGGAGGAGGGIYNAGTMTLTDSTVTGNTTGVGGPATNAPPASNFGGHGGAGAGIYNTGSLTVTNSTITGNTTGAGVVGGFGGSGGIGGGINSTGTLVVNDSVIAENTTGAGGAGTNSGASGGTGGFGAGLAVTGTADITGTDIRDNTGGVGGAGDGSGGGGTGLYVASGTATLVRSKVRDNRAGNSAPPVGPAATGGFGGGILNAGHLTVTESTISGNQTGTGSSSGAGVGGGISNGGTLLMANSTVSGNTTAGSGGQGAGIFNTGPLTLTNCTITANTTGSGFGGAGVHAFNSSSGPINVANTIIAGNLSADNSNVSDVHGGPYTSLGHNLIGNADGSTGFGAAGDQVGTFGAPLDPRLGPLAANGGPTLTHALLPGSTAIDAGDDSLAKDAGGALLTTDQRGAGFPRFADSLDAGTTATVDIGAVEAELFLEDVADHATAEDTFVEIPFGLSGQIGMSAESSDETLVPDANFTFLVTGTQTRTLQILPAPNRFGSATITLTVHGPQGQTLSDTFTLTVNPVNDPPSFTKGADHVTSEDAGAQTVAAWATGMTAGPNESGQTLTFVVTGNTNSALFSSGPAVNSDGTLSYTPATNANGVAQINLALKDDGGTAGGGADTSPGQVFQIVVNAVNDAPTANAQTVTADEDTAKAVTLTGSDVEGSALTFSITAQPAHGTLTGTGAARTYTPNANFNGADSFKFKTRDGQLDSAEATVQINVGAQNDAPLNTVPGAQSVVQHGARVFSAAGANAITVADVDAGAGGVRVTLTASNGTLTLATVAGLAFTSGDGVSDPSMTFNGTTTAVNVALSGLTFRPNAGFSGAAGLQIVTSDMGRTGAGGAKTDTDAVAITVQPGGVLQPSAATYEASEATTTATFTVTRTGGAAGAASVNYATSSGTAAGSSSCGAGADFVNKSGALSWAAGDTASKTFTVTLCNDSLHESDETFGLTLSGASGSATIGARASASVTLRDDDPAGGRFEFNSSAYGVVESAGSRTITVRRTGDVTRAATVDYATDDGATAATFTPCNATSGRALDRCDFAQVSGRLSFAAGETQKTFKVLISDDEYVEGAETLALRLSNPGGSSALGTLSTVTLTITDDVPETTTNPLDESRKFVRQQYLDFFTREPDAAGLDFWSSQIDSCGADAACVTARRENVSAAFFLSAEFRETGYLVYRTYQAAFASGPALPYKDFLPDAQAVGRDVVVGRQGWPQLLEQNKRAYLDEFVARQTFRTAYPASMSAAAFVDKLNANVGGALSQSERSALAGALAAGTKTRAEVLRAVAEDADLDARERNRAFVLMQYFGYMRRNPPDPPEATLDFQGYNFWLGKLNDHDGNFISAEMVKAFITSGEYRQRFGQ
ncbi:MAG TPA: Calx-beta domain-containing protein [Pyrinomonadaceae bacterium]|nr:Calx-beta domain-containing protein [Pyrinomonadaceae bacterium]